MTYKKERGMGMELKIPENFFVGAAMSGPQTEGAYKTGGRLESIWDTWSDLSISDFYNKVGSYVGNNFYEKYEDDIKLLKSLHMDSFRTSMQWSRLLTKDGKLNQEGAQFYHKVCKCAKENQIELFMNLYHFDMPTYLFERGGWESRDVVEAYAAYARAAFREFGSEIRYFQRTHRRTRSALPQRFLVSFYKGCKKRNAGSVSSVPCPQSGCMGIQKGKRRGLCKRGCKDRPDQLFCAALYKRRSYARRSGSFADGGWDQQPVVAGSGGRRTSARGRSFYKEGREMKRY